MPAVYFDIFDNSFFVMDQGITVFSSANRNCKHENDRQACVAVVSCHLRKFQLLRILLRYERNLVGSEAIGQLQSFIPMQQVAPHLNSAVPQFGGLYI